MQEVTKTLTKINSALRVLKGEGGQRKTQKRDYKKKDCKKRDNINNNSLQFFSVDFG